MPPVSGRARVQDHTLWRRGPGVPVAPAACAFEVIFSFLKGDDDGYSTARGDLNGANRPHYYQGFVEPAWGRVLGPPSARGLGNLDATKEVSTTVAGSARKFAFSSP